MLLKTGPEKGKTGWKISSDNVGVTWSIFTVIDDLWSVERLTNNINIFSNKKEMCCNL